MYFIKYIDKELSLHPSRFNEDVFKMLKKSLYDEEEGTCNGEYFTICIMDFHNISAGKVRLGSGMGEYKITYRAIIWKPFKGETVGHNCAASVIGLSTDVEKIRSTAWSRMSLLTVSLPRLVL
jgi:DNA-directed RNA polymerase subunit E'/Rpb7